MDFRGRPFDFWGGYGWLQKKCPADWFREEKSMQINSSEKNILHWTKYRSWLKMLRKNRTPLYVGEKISNSREVWEKILLIQTKSVKSPIPHVQWSCQPFRGWRKKKRIWHLCKCHPSTKWLARVHDVVVFKTKVLHFKIENTSIEDKWKNEIVFRGIQPCFLHGGSQRLACSEPTKAARFLKKLEVHSVPYDQRKVRF